MNKELTQREFASKGGKARAEKLSKERRKEIALMGVEAKRRKLDESKKVLSL